MTPDRIRNAIHALSEAGIVTWTEQSLFDRWLMFPQTRLVHPPRRGTLLVDNEMGVIMANAADFTMADGDARAVVLRME